MKRSLLTVRATVRATAAFALAGLTTITHALESIQPGLWEHTYTIKSESGELEQALEEVKAMLNSMPPKQRKLMEDTMAEEGVSMDFANNTLRVCITQAQAQRNQLPQLGNGDCEQEVVSESDNHFTVTFNCPTRPPSSGKTTVRVLDSKAYHGDMVINTNINGQAEKLTATTEGKWIRSDCGNVKPVN